MVVLSVTVIVSLLVWRTIVAHVGGSCQTNTPAVGLPSCGHGFDDVGVGYQMIQLRLTHCICMCVYQPLRPWFSNSLSVLNTRYQCSSIQHNLFHRVLATCE